MTSLEDFQSGLPGTPGQVASDSGPAVSMVGAESVGHGVGHDQDLAVVEHCVEPLGELVGVGRLVHHMPHLGERCVGDPQRDVIGCRPSRSFTA